MDFQICCYKTLECPYKGNIEETKLYTNIRNTPTSQYNNLMENISYFMSTQYQVYNHLTLWLGDYKPDIAVII